MGLRACLNQNSCRLERRYEVLAREFRKLPVRSYVRGTSREEDIGSRDRLEGALLRISLIAVDSGRKVQGERTIGCGLASDQSIAYSSKLLIIAFLILSFVLSAPLLPAPLSFSPDAVLVRHATMANPNALFLLADHIKLSLLERQRTKALDLLQDTADAGGDDSNRGDAQDGQISRSLDQFRDGLVALQREQTRLEGNGEAGYV